MTKDEALKLALEVIEAIHIQGDVECVVTPNGTIYLRPTITAIKEALAQPEQKPVGDEWTPCMKLPVVVHVRKQRPGEVHVSTREGITPVKLDDLIMQGVSGEEYPIGRAIFEQTYSLDTTPPLPVQRQPLTDEAKAVIAAAKVAMDASFETNNRELDISIPAHLAAALSLRLDEFEAAHNIGAKP